MIHVERIDNLEDVSRMITEQEYRPDLDRYRTHYVYRGMPDASFVLETSVRRNCKEHTKDLEPAILKNFTKYAELEEPTVSRSVWHQMILGQHHGLPTRLLDWSQSPLVGLHFAVTENDMDMMEAHDCVVWRMDMSELHNLLPSKYQHKIDSEKTLIFSVDKFHEVCPTIFQYDEDMKGNAMVLIEPPSIDLRIVNQYSFFSIVPLGMESIEEFLDKNTNNTVKYVIDRKLRWRIRDMLDQLNISERIVYPGLDGLCKWLGRHYFVK